MQRRAHAVLEPRIPTPRSFIKPDILIINNDIAHVMDLAVCDSDRLSRTYQLRIEKHGVGVHVEAITQYLRGAYSAVKTIQHQPVIFDNRGMIYSPSAKRLLTCGLTKLDNSDMCIWTIQLTMKVYDTYMRGATFTQRQQQQHTVVTTSDGPNI